MNRTFARVAILSLGLTMLAQSASSGPNGDPTCAWAAETYGCKTDIDSTNATYVLSAREQHWMDATGAPGSLKELEDRLLGENVAALVDNIGGFAKNAGFARSSFVLTQAEPDLWANSTENITGRSYQLESKIGIFEAFDGVGGLFSYTSGPLTVRLIPHGQAKILIPNRLGEITSSDGKAYAMTVGNATIALDGTKGLTATLHDGQVLISNASTWFRTTSYLKATYEGRLTAEAQLDSSGNSSSLQATSHGSVMNATWLGDVPQVTVTAKDASPGLVTLLTDEDPGFHGLWNSPVAIDGHPACLGPIDQVLDGTSIAPAIARATNGTQHLIIFEYPGGTRSHTLTFQPNSRESACTAPDPAPVAGNVSGNPRAVPAGPMLPALALLALVASLRPRKTSR